MVPSFGGNVAHAITSSIGLVINSAIVLALLYTPGVLVSRLHFALLYLMCVFIVGSLPIAAMNIRLAVYPTPIPDIGMRIIASILEFAVVGVFGLNVVLAFERWSAFRDIDGAIRSKTYKLICGTTFLCWVAAVSCYFSTGSDDGIRPNKKPELFIWMGANSLLFNISVSTVVALYSQTYSYAKRALRSLQASDSREEYLTELNSRLTEGCEPDEEEEMRAAANKNIRQEREILIGCITLFCWLIIFYTPTLVVHTLLDLIGMEVNERVVIMADVFSDLDSILTPAFTLYFQPDFRDSVYHFYFG